MQFAFGDKVCGSVFNAFISPLFLHCILASDPTMQASFFVFDGYKHQDFIGLFIKLHHQIIVMTGSCFHIDVVRQIAGAPPGRSFLKNMASKAKV